MSYIETFKKGESMAFVSGFTTSTVASSSALRFGLIDVKPIEVRETIHRWGLKFVRISRSLETLQPSRSFSDYMTLTYEGIFSQIPVPSQFEREKLVEYFAKRAVERFENDKELQEAIHELEEARHKRTITPLLSYVRFIKDRYETRKQLFSEIEADRFLNSNFPLSFYSKFVLFDDTHGAFLNLIEKRVRHHERLASLPRARSEFRIFSRRIGQMKSELSPFIDQMDACVFSLSCLKMYVSLWNTKDYEEMRDPEFLDINKVDYNELKKLDLDFKEKLSETRKYLFQFDPSVFDFQIDLNEPTTQMYSKLLTVPLVGSK